MRIKVLIKCVEVAAPEVDSGGGVDVSFALSLDPFQCHDVYSRLEANCRTWFDFVVNLRPADDISGTGKWMRGQKSPRISGT